MGSGYGQAAIPGLAGLDNRSPKDNARSLALDSFPAVWAALMLSVALLPGMPTAATAADTAHSALVNPDPPTGPHKSRTAT